MLIIISSQDVS